LSSDLIPVSVMKRAIVCESENAVRIPPQIKAQAIAVIAEITTRLTIAVKRLFSPFRLGLFFAIGFNADLF
jgi:hypothetical protein